MDEVIIKKEYEVNEDVFEQYVGRKPKDQDELITFANLVEKGIEWQLSWDVLYDCAAYEIKMSDSHEHY